MEQRIKALQEQMEQQISQINSKENLGAFWQDFLPWAKSSTTSRSRWRKNIKR